MLLVDDDGKLRGMIARLLALVVAVEVFEADDGVEALEAAQRLRPALIMTDVKMPRMDGLTLLRRLKADETTRAIPVIVFSSASHYGRAVRDDGAAGFLAKPFLVDELATTVRAVLTDGHAWGQEA
jgi:two-component system response regulator MprA